MATSTTRPINAADAKAIAQDGYVFGLPLVYIARQADVLTNVAKPEGGRAPFNQFDHHRAFPDAKNNKIVGMNVDTLYSLANLDLTAEPIVLVVPPMDGQRWWIMQVIDAWNDVPAAPGSRTHGSKGGAFVIAGPTFKGGVPAGLDVIRCDTSLCALGGRTYTRGPDDYAAVRKIQDACQLIPLSRWNGKDTRYAPPASVPVRPGVDARTPVPTQISAMSAQQFFNRLCELLVNNPGREADAPILARLATLGIAPGAAFEMTTLPEDVRTAIDAGVAAAQQAIRDEESKMGEMVNGWQVARDLGRYGTRYTYRAAWTFFAVGGNLVEDAIYPIGLVDADGKRFDGASQYVLRFAKDQIPPVDAFWSLTLYDKDSYLVDNPLNRYALGDRSHCAIAPDGSLTLYIQSASPGPDKEDNWLPAPKSGPFKLALRLYVPKASVSNGTWKPPAVQRSH
ncbi:MAG TPA: DUF1254 domain-containing protein [Vicinamibacterales bacterium]|jgi:hypothetical protein|nr:DUF1254 domain-containing protein [Vicinamibacterales bacterium]